MPHIEESIGHKYNDDEVRLRILGVFNLLTAGLATSAVSAFLVSLPMFHSIFFSEMGGLTGVGWGAVLMPLALLIVSAFVRSSAASKYIFWPFMILQGLGLYIVLSSVSVSTAIQAISATAALFGGMTLYGYTTKRDLSGMGPYLFGALISLIVISIIQIFVGGDVFGFLISLASVVLFAGYTAYDIQTIRDNAVFDNDDYKYSAALNLYLDVINMLYSLVNILDFLKR